jgi:acyl carrier protein
MTTLDEAKAFLKSHLADKLKRAGIAEPSDDLSLTNSGVIDSFGLVDLVGAAERKFSIEIDIDGADMEEFSTFGGLARSIAASSG